MTIIELAGCAFVAFGPSFVLFMFTVASNPLRVILLTASAFFWLMSLLVSSLLWFLVTPLQDVYAFGLIFSVVFQELFRFLFYLLLRKARAGLEIVQNTGNEAKMPLNPFMLHYVSGLGFGVISCAFSFVNILREMRGPGTIGIQGDSQYFFLISAFMSSAFVLLHIFWAVVFCSSLDSPRAWKKALGVCGVIGSHILVSSLTLLNQQTPPMYAASLTAAYVSVVVMGTWAFASVGGTAQSFIKFLNPCSSSSIVITRSNQD